MMDFPARIVALSARILPRGRAEWASAMSAELSQLAEGPARWVFALECVRASLSAPAPPGRGAPGKVVSATFIAGIVGCVGTWMYVLQTWPHASREIAPATIAQFLPMVAIYLWLAIRPPEALVARGDAVRRGVGSGFLLFIVITILSPILDQVIRSADPDTLVVLLEMPAVIGTFGYIGYRLARDEGSFGAGLISAFWAGTVCSILAYNADLVTLLGRFDLEGHFQGVGGDRTLVLADPDAWLSKHVGDHLNSTMLSLRAFPILALALGAIGAGVGRFANRRAQTPPRGGVIVV
jgi:hypothetical protein